MAWGWSTPENYREAHRIVNQNVSMVRRPEIPDLIEMDLYFCLTYGIVGSWDCCQDGDRDGHGKGFYDAEISARGI